LVILLNVFNVIIITNDSDKCLRQVLFNNDLAPKIFSTAELRGRSSTQYVCDSSS